jgi:hypothetical protein
MNSVFSINNMIWTVPFFLGTGGVQTVVVGQPSSTIPIRLEKAVKNYRVAGLTSDGRKSSILQFLYEVLHFLREHVRENGVYLFSRWPDQVTGQHRLYLYQVMDGKLKGELTFISKRMVDELIDPNPVAH